MGRPRPLDRHGAFIPYVRSSSIFPVRSNSITFHSFIRNLLFLSSSRFHHASFFSTTISLLLTDTASSQSLTALHFRNSATSSFCSCSHCSLPPHQHSRWIRSISKRCAVIGPMRCGGASPVSSSIPRVCLRFYIMNQNHFRKRNRS